MGYLNHTSAGHYYRRQFVCPMDGIYRNNLRESDFVMKGRAGVESRRETSGPNNRHP